MRRIVTKIINHVRGYSHVDVAKKMGVEIGQNCKILADPYDCFSSEPYLIEIGDYVEITSGCRFITHDGAMWVLRNAYVMKNADKFGKIKVGNNVFIGINTIILPGVHIGNNCIIGAGTVLTKSIPDGEVWAGNPAKYICSVQEYKNRMMKQIDYTKGLTPKEKKQAIYKMHPEWFSKNKEL